MKLILLSLLIALASPAPAPAITTAADQDVVLNAMSDELNRSVQDLKLEHHEKPYYVGYRIDDTDTLDIGGSFGAITNSHRTKYRMLSVDVHVGDYSLDSGNVQGFYSLDDGLPVHEKLCLDDNYDSIRHTLWLETDQSYKHAIQNLEKKKADLQQKTTKDRPDDWSHEQPVVEIQPKQVLTADRQSWEQTVRKLTQVFKNYPTIRSSSVHFFDIAANEYFLNNEGTKCRVEEGKCYLTVTATAQAKDGMKMSDSLVVGASDDKHMPPLSDLEARTKVFADGLSKAALAKESEWYEGPVLLQGQAAASFFNKALAQNLTAHRSSDVESPFSDGNDGGSFQARIGRRILPTFISVVDDPTLKDASGTPLIGSYEIDDEGVKGQRVQLVEKGILKTLLSTRLPTAKIKNSNGHSNNGKPVATNLIVESDSKLSPKDLQNKLIELGKQDGLDYVIVVRSLASGGNQNGEAIVIGGFGDSDSGADKITLPPPLDISRLYLADGHEEPVRGAEFTMLTTRMLKDIVAAGDDSAMYTYQDTGDASTVTSPSIIIGDVDMRKSHANSEKPPILTHPYFEKQ